MKPYLMEEMTWPEIEKKFKDSQIVLLPAGSTEQHGPHMPMGVDTYIPLHVAKAVSKNTGTPIVPPIWFTTCEHHMSFPGTITIRPTTLMALLRDICTSLYKHGIRDVVILNGHTSGANPSLLATAEELQHDYKDLRLWVVDVVKMAWKTINKVCEAEILFHADEVEVSQMLVIREDLVDLKKAEKIIPKQESQFVKIDYRQGGDEVLTHYNSLIWKSRVTPKGQVGDPTIATKEKGQAILDTLIVNVTKLIREIKELK